MSWQVIKVANFILKLSVEYNCSSQLSGSSHVIGTHTHVVNNIPETLNVRI